MKIVRTCGFGDYEETIEETDDPEAGVEEMNAHMKTVHDVPPEVVPDAGPDSV